MRTRHAGGRGRRRSSWKSKQGRREEGFFLGLRRLGLEPLEDRRLLSVGLHPPPLQPADIATCAQFGSHAVGDGSSKWVTPGESGDGVTDLIVTEDGLTIDTDGIAITSYLIQSAAAIFTGEPADNVGGFGEDSDGFISSFFLNFNGTHFLGDVIGDEFDDVDLFEDLTFTYTMPGGIFRGTLIFPVALIDVALIPVLTPSPSSLPGSELPTPLESIALGETYYVEIWAQDTGSPGAGISGGTVDLYYTTSLADATAVANLDFDLLPSGTIYDAAGLVDDLGGGTLVSGAGVGPDWARLAYVEFVQTGLGNVTFSLSPGSLPFSRDGVGNVAWYNVNLGEGTTVTQGSAVQVDMTLVCQPSVFDDQDTGELSALPQSEPWLHEWEPFWLELWVSTPDSTELGVSGGTVRLRYDTSFATAELIEHGPAFTDNQGGTIDDSAGLIADLGADTVRADVGDDRFGLLARIRFVPTPADRATADELGHCIGPYDLDFVLVAGQMKLAGVGPVVTELGAAPSPELFAVPYDVEENDRIDFGDFSFFAPALDRPVGEAEPPYTWWADFDKSGYVDLDDFGCFTSNFARGKPDDEIVFPPSFPDAWLTPPKMPAASTTASAVCLQQKCDEFAADALAEGAAKRMLPGESGDGVADVVVTDEGLVIDTDGFTMRTYLLSSAAGIFTGEPANGLGTLQIDEDREISGFLFALNGTHFLGDVIGDEFDDVDLFKDLGFSYITVEEGGIFQGTLLYPVPVIDVALIPVLTPSPSSLPAAQLPTPVESVAVGDTYYVEIWVEDLGTPGVGISGGTVDLHYTTSLVDATGVVNLDFDVLASGSIHDAAGLVDDLGGGTFLSGAAVGPGWARLACVEFVRTGLGDVTFTLSPGSLQFSRSGEGNVPWYEVDLGEETTVSQDAAARIDVTLVRQPTPFDDQDAGEVGALPQSEPWVHEWEPFWIELWAGTPASSDAGVSGGSVDLWYDTNLATAELIEYGPAFTDNQSGIVDDSAGWIDDVGADAIRADVGDDRFALLARIRFVPTPADRAMADEFGHCIGPYDLDFVLVAAEMKLSGIGRVTTELGAAPSTELFAVPYDVEESDRIDFGDFSLFAAAFNRPVGEAEPPYTWWADFDKSGYVDFGDFSYFTPNFTHRKPDDEIVFPPNFPDAWRMPPKIQAGSTTASAVRLEEKTNELIKVELVAGASPTASDEVTTLPDSLSEVPLGSTFYVEVWIQDVGIPGVGIAGGYVDLGHTAAETNAVAFSHGGVFTALSSGSIDNDLGRVDDFGGGTFGGGTAVEPNWARLGFVEYTVTGPGPIRFTLSPGGLPFGRYAGGNVPWENVTLGHLALNMPAARVVDRHVFYNNSSFDGNSSAANAQDDEAIAADKQALLPGGTASFDNYTSYSRGINGIMIDVDNLAGEPTVADFEFKVGNDDEPAGWTPLVATPIIAVRQHAGIDGSDRVTIIWPDNVIQKQWLQVTVLAGANTGLDEPDVFYFGNAVGESGNLTTDAKVNADDMLGARDNQRTFINPAPVDFNYDYNRDARVDAYDMLIARDNQTHFLNALKLITVPSGKVADAAAAAAGSAHDAVLEQAVERESARRETLSGRMAWLWEFEPISATDRLSEENGSDQTALVKLTALI